MTNLKMDKDCCQSHRYGRVSIVERPNLRRRSIPALSPSRQAESQYGIALLDAPTTRPTIDRAEAMRTPRRAPRRAPPQIVALGGGGFSMEKDSSLLDDYMLSLTGSARPRMCFLPTASGDADHYVVRFYRRFSARLRRLATSRCSAATRASAGSRTISPRTCSRRTSSTSAAATSCRCSAPGAPTAWTRSCAAPGGEGIVLCGPSAGSLCWFAESASSLPRRAPARARPRPAALLQLRALRRRARAPRRVPPLRRRGHAPRLRRRGRRRAALPRHAARARRQLASRRPRLPRRARRGLASSRSRWRSPSSASCSARPSSRRLTPSRRSRQ